MHEYMKTKHILGLLEEYGLRLWPRAHKSRFINSLAVGSEFPPQVLRRSWKANCQLNAELAHATRSAEEISCSRESSSLKGLCIVQTIHWAQVVQPAQELLSFCNAALQRFPSSKDILVHHNHQLSYMWKFWVPPTLPYSHAPSPRVGWDRRALEEDWNRNELGLCQKSQRCSHDHLHDLRGREQKYELYRKVLGHLTQKNNFFPPEFSNTYTRNNWPSTSCKLPHQSDWSNFEGWRQLKPLSLNLAVSLNSQGKMRWPREWAFLKECQYFPLAIRRRNQWNMLHSALLSFCSSFQPAPGRADTNNNKSKPERGEQFWTSAASGGSVTEHRLQRHVGSRIPHNEFLTHHKNKERKFIPAQITQQFRKTKCVWEKKNSCKSGG